MGASVKDPLNLSHDAGFKPDYFLAFGPLFLWIKIYNGQRQEHGQGEEGGWRLSDDGVLHLS